MSLLTTLRMVARDQFEQGNRFFVKSICYGIEALKKYAVSRN